MSATLPQRGKDGRDGRDGRQGPQGPRGYDGRDGRDGVDGRDAYELARKHQAFAGDVAEWLASLRGEKGLDGQQGPEGPPGPRGPQGPIGPMPLHEWRDTELRFELRPGQWGEWVDLQGPPGEPGTAGTGIASGIGAGPLRLPFTALSDVPSSYVGYANRVVAVKSDESGLEFVVGGGGGGGTPGGANTQVQFNDSGAFGGDSGLTFNKTTNVLSVNGSANSLTLAGSSAGNAVAVTPTGSDSSIALKLAPKGAQGFVQAGPNTYGVSGWAGYNLSLEIYNTSATEQFVRGCYVEIRAADVAAANVRANHFIADAPASMTHDVALVEGTQGYAQSSMGSGRTASALIGVNGQIYNGGAGTVTSGRSFLAQALSDGGGPITTAWNYYALMYDTVAAAGTGKSYQFYGKNQDRSVKTSEAYGLWLDDMSSTSTIADNPFYSWYDCPGVRLVTGAGISQYYNPGFATKYAVGVSNYERLVQQWNSNVAEIGTQAGGTGTQRDLRLLGAAINVPSLTASNFVVTDASKNLLSKTNTQATALLDAMVGDGGSGGTKGLVPAPATGDATKFLRGDGTWAAAAGGGGGDALTSNPLSQFAATTSLQLKGVISDETGSGALVFADTPALVAPILGTPTSGTLTNCTIPVGGISGLGTNVATWLATPSSANLAAALTDETGSGKVVLDTSPTLVTPTLGVASATSINKVALTAPASGSTLTIADGKTLTASNTITLTGTDGVSQNVSNAKIAQITGFLDGGGAAIQANSTTICIPCAFAGTITAYTITVDTGTCTIKTWKKAAGTAIPTGSDSISTSGVAISSGTAVRSTTVSDFTSTTVTANDLFIFTVTAISGATKISFTLEITKT